MSGRLFCQTVAGVPASLLLALTVFLTTRQTVADIVVVALHYPLFLLATVILDELIPSNARLAVTAGVASIIVEQRAITGIQTG